MQFTEFSLSRDYFRHIYMWDTTFGNQHAKVSRTTMLMSTKHYSLTHIAPRDYETSGSHLTFDRNQDRACIAITLNADNLLEHTEQFGVELSVDTREPVVLATSAALVNIIDANSKPAVKK